MSADTTAADIGLPDGFKGEQSVPPTRSTTRRVPSTTAGSIGTRSSSSSRLERRTSGDAVAFARQKLPLAFGVGVTRSPGSVQSKAAC